MDGADCHAGGVTWGDQQHECTSRTKSLDGASRRPRLERYGMF